MTCPKRVENPLSDADQGIDIVKIQSDRRLSGYIPKARPIRAIPSGIRAGGIDE